jgi:hypothetical protein
MEPGSCSLSYYKASAPNPSFRPANIQSTPHGPILFLRSHSTYPPPPRFRLAWSRHVLRLRPCRPISNGAHPCYMPSPSHLNRNVKCDFRSQRLPCCPQHALNGSPWHHKRQFCSCPSRHQDLGPQAANQWLVLKLLIRETPSSFLSHDAWVITALLSFP